MASNKNQHFVPKCYLRPFTIRGEGAAINLYNIDRQRLIRMAPVKNQCSRDYFYGNDERLEAAIQHLEGQYGIALSEILSPGYELVDRHRDLLRKFWLFQNLRTEAASKRVVEMTEGMRVTAGIGDPRFRLEIRESVEIAMQTFSDCMEIMSDMKVCLLKNKSEIPFVTSDDPAILTNRWYFESPKTKGMAFGLTSSGNILVLPLSPSVLCLGYDGDVYSVPHTRGWVEIRNNTDVEALNQHQFLNCRANIFVQNPAHADLVNSAFLKSLPLRPTQRHRVYYAVRDRAEGDHVRYVTVDPSEAHDEEDALLQMKTVRPAPTHWPQQIRWRNKGSVWSNGTAVGYVRARFAQSGPGPRYWREPAR